MKPLDLLKAVKKVSTLWPDADIHATVAQTLNVFVGAEYVGWIDCIDASVHTVTGQTFRTAG